MEFEAGKNAVRLIRGAETGIEKPLILLLAGDSDGDGEKFAVPGADVAVVSGMDWNRDLSPWPADRAFARGEDFAGGADAYLSELLEEVLPAIHRALGRVPAVHGIAGYSLAGLFAVYAAWKAPVFVRAASMSGSMWYDGVLDFLRAEPPAGGIERCYFSLGSKESATKNARIAAVGKCTEEAAEILRGYGADVTFEWNPGNHFTDVPWRIGKGLKALV